MASHEEEEKIPMDQPSTSIEDEQTDRPATRTAASPTTKKIRIMIAGDSITHGHEGDFTWRYRLWEWLQQAQQNTSTYFEFVGPYTGVDAPLAVLPPRPPQPTESPLPFDLTVDYPGTGPFRIRWGYAEEVSKEFDAHHFSTSGYQVRLAQQVIEKRIREYEPDVVLVLLGYNDLSWSCRYFDNSKCLDPDRAEIVLQDMERFVENARAGKKGMKFAMGNIVHRTAFREDVPANTETYNKLLAKKVKEGWGRPDSPTHLVDVASMYSCGPTGKAGGEGCPAAFDGLHPNSLGDYQIAAAFAKVLVEDMDVGLQGASLLEIPERSTLPKKDLSPPQKEDMKAEGSPMGVALTWQRRYGIVTYEAAQRRLGVKGDEDKDWEIYRRFYNRTDVIDPSPGTEYEFKLRACYGLDCSGAWSEIVSAVSTRGTGPPPTNIRTRSTPDGFHISWSPPENGGHQEWNISEYEFGHTYPGWPMWASIGSLGHDGNVTGLLKGEKRSIRVATWTEPEGGSVYRYGRPIIVGEGTPGPLRGLKVKRINTTSVKATWEEASGAAGYLVEMTRFGQERKRSASGGAMGSEGVDDPVIAYITEQVLDLPETLRGQHSICVVAVNGELQSEAACSIIGQPTLSLFSTGEYTRSFSYWGAVFPLALLLGTWLFAKKVARERRRSGDIEAIALK